VFIWRKSAALNISIAEGKTLEKTNSGDLFGAGRGAFCAVFARATD
jgi:hypothetical protein